MPQNDINRILIEAARAGENVVRLKGGDPFVFGRGGEECLALAEAGLSCEVVPGLSSALAAPACAGIPLSHRGLSGGIHIIGWHGKDGPPSAAVLEALFRAGGSIVILMGASVLGEISLRLGEAGFPPETPAAFIENGAAPGQRVIRAELCRLGEISPSPGCPGLIVAGAVSSLAARIALPQASLRGPRVVVTRREPHNAELCQKIRAAGGEAIPFPCIKVIPLESSPEFRPGPDCRWIVFTSAAGVDFFFDGFLRSGGDLRRFADKFFAAVGPATGQALGRRGFIPDFVPASSGGRGLGEGLAEKIPPGGEALLVHGLTASPELPSVLRENGVIFRELAVYDTVFTEGGAFARKEIEAGRFDYVFFSSASAVSGFAAAFPGLNFSAVKAVCAGDPTAARCREFGMECRTANEPVDEAMLRLVRLWHN